MISVMAEAGAPLRLLDISKRLKISQATALRHLNGLIQEGYCYQEEHLGRYALTLKICGVADMLRSRVTIRSLAGEMISGLSTKLSVGASLSVQHNMECIYLDCVYEPGRMDFSLQRIGKQTPMHTTSSGKLFLTEFSKDELDSLIKEKGLAKLTDNTITTRELLDREIADVKKKGYATDNEECELGLRCIAYPVRDSFGKIVAATSCFSSVKKMTNDFISDQVKPELCRVAEELSKRMGFTA